MIDCNYFVVNDLYIFTDIKGFLLSANDNE